tara:strand:- start:30433 stop:30594 length:162 start_codon:yes stop_codon:yes gene_type:complete
VSKEVKEVKEKKETSINEAIENIQNQLQNYKIMTIKAEGALEVLMQLKKDEDG